MIFATAERELMPYLGVLGVTDFTSGVGQDVESLTQSLSQEFGHSGHVKEQQVLPIGEHPNESLPSHALVALERCQASLDEAFSALLSSSSSPASSQVSSGVSYKDDEHDKGWPPSS